MYRIRADEDFSYLINSEIIQVCLGQNEAILNFDDGGLRITILARFEVTVDGTEYVFEESLLGAGILVALTHDPIAQVEVVNDTTLCILLASGNQLRLFDDSEQYESFTIEHDATIYVV
jgi:hypothetical protein